MSEFNPTDIITTQKKSMINSSSNRIITADDIRNNREDIINSNINGNMIDYGITLNEMNITVRKDIQNAIDHVTNKIVHLSSSDRDKLNAIKIDQLQILSSLGDQTYELKNQVGVLTDKTTEMSGQISALTDKAVKTTNQINSLSNKADTFSNQYNTLDDKTTQLSNQVNLLKNQTNGFSNQIVTLTGETTGLRNKISALTDKTTEMSGQINSLSDKTTEITNQISKIGNGGTNQTINIPNINNTIDEIKNNTTAVGKSLTELSSKYNTEIPPMQKKLSGIQDNANNYVHPKISIPYNISYYGVSIDDCGHVINGINDPLTIPGLAHIKDTVFENPSLKIVPPITSDDNSIVCSKWVKMLISNPVSVQNTAPVKTNTLWINTNDNSLYYFNDNKKSWQKYSPTVSTYEVSTSKISDTTKLWIDISDISNPSLKYYSYQDNTWKLISGNNSKQNSSLYMINSTKDESKLNINTISSDIMYFDKTNYSWNKLEEYKINDNASKLAPDHENKLNIMANQTISYTDKEDSNHYYLPLSYLSGSATILSDEPINNKNKIWVKKDGTKYTFSTYVGNWTDYKSNVYISYGNCLSDDMKIYNYPITSKDDLLIYNKKLYGITGSWSSFNEYCTIAASKPTKDVIDKTLDYNGNYYWYDTTNNKMMVTYIDNNTHSIALDSSGNYNFIELTKSSNTPFYSVSAGMPKENTGNVKYIIDTSNTGTPLLSKIVDNKLSPVNAASYYSGANEPKSPINKQIWLDTSNNTLKIYNNNNQWIDLNNLYDGYTISNTAPKNIFSLWINNTNPDNIQVLYWPTPIWHRLESYDGDYIENLDELNRNFFLLLFTHSNSNNEDSIVGVTLKTFTGEWIPMSTYDTNPPKPATKPAETPKPAETTPPKTPTEPEAPKTTPTVDTKPKA